MFTVATAVQRIMRVFNGVVSQEANILVIKKLSKKPNVAEWPREFTDPSKS
jgi:hypothetical protein